MTKATAAFKASQAFYFDKLLKEAHDAAGSAIDAKGPENMHALDCGFAWVVLRPATHPLAAHCRKYLKAAANPGSPAAGNLRATSAHYYGHKHWNGGWEWWGPGNFNGQAIGHKIAGAQAFRDVLARHNISAEVGSRYD